MPKPRVSTVLQRAAPGTSVSVLLDSAASPASRQACMYPDCRRKCTWETGGRPGVFCGASCRRNFASARRALLADLGALETLSHPGMSFAERRALEQAIGLRRWALARYPELPHSPSRS